MGWLNYLCAVAVIHEIADKAFDLLTTITYHNEKLFYHPKESVYAALVVFLIIGWVVSVVLIYLYGRKIYGYTEDSEIPFEDCSICVNAFKIVFEAFPQSVIAKFVFNGCPIKTSEWKFLDTSFDVFCGTPFVFFFISSYCCCGRGSENGKRMFHIMASTAVISIVGLGFAIESFVHGVHCP